MTIEIPQSASLRRGLQIGGATSALIASVVVIATVTSTDPTLTFACLVVLIAGAKLLWRPGEPPILFAAFFLQWLQVSLAIFHASFNGVELTDYYFSGGIIEATWLSLFGLMVLAGGIRLALCGVEPIPWTDLVSEVRRFSVRKAFAVYCVVQVVAAGIGTMSTMVPGLRQELFALSNFRWMFFFLLAMIVFVQKRGYGILMVVVAFESVLGFLSFFAEYRVVFLMLTLAFLTVRPKLNFRTLMASALIVGTVLVLSAVWSVIKLNYRDFLNAGTGQQMIVVSQEEQVTRLSSLMLDEGLTRLPEGFDRLTRRIEYTYFFGRVVDRVPAMIPFDNGALWAAAVVHVLTPRLLFPDKATLSSDVVNTQHYAGLKLTEQGGWHTEIPMGYMAESYVDFGPIGMFVPIFLLGGLFGLQYRYIITRKRYLLFALGAVPVVLMSASQFETSAVKMLGGSLMSFGMFVIAFHLIVPYLPRSLRSLLEARRSLPQRSIVSDGSHC